MKYCVHRSHPPTKKEAANVIVKIGLNNGSLAFYETSNH